MVAEEGEAAVAEPGDGDLDALTRQLWEGIPLSAAVGIEVVDAGPDVVRIRAPFAPNRNYHGTVFGGSIAVVGIVAGWLTVTSGLRAAGTPAEVVIQSTAIEYLKPATGTLMAEAHRPDGWDRFMRTFERYGRARVEVSTDLVQDGRTVARLKGTYAALVRA